MSFSYANSAPQISSLDFTGHFETEEREKEKERKGRKGAE